MKTIKKIVVALMLMVVFIPASLAESPDEIKAAESPYRQVLLNEVRELVVYPDYAIELGVEGFVLVSFSYDANGRLKILESNSNSEMLKYHVTNTLEDLDMCTHAKAAGKVYNMRFDFVLK